MICLRAEGSHLGHPHPTIPNRGLLARRSRRPRRGAVRLPVRDDAALGERGGVHERPRRSMNATSVHWIGSRRWIGYEKMPYTQLHVDPVDEQRRPAELEHRAPGRVARLGRERALHVDVDAPHQDQHDADLDEVVGRRRGPEVRVAGAGRATAGSSRRSRPRAAAPRLRPRSTGSCATRRPGVFAVSSHSPTSAPANT